MDIRPLDGGGSRVKISYILKNISSYLKALETEQNGVLDKVYPVGSIYMSVSNISPATLFGGTWEQIKDTFLLSAGDTYSAGNTGGEATHILNTGEMPAHTHGSKSLSGTLYAYAWNNGGSSGIVSNTTPHKNMDMLSGDSVGHQYYTINASHEHESVGDGTAHNNMPPYLVVYIWKRTA